MSDGFIFGSWKTLGAAMAEEESQRIRGTDVKKLVGRRKRLKSEADYLFPAATTGEQKLRTSDL